MAAAAAVASLLVASAAGARAVPMLTRRITDESGTLTPSDRARLEDKLAAYEKSTGHQLAVLIIPSLEGEVIEQYSIKVVEHWELGDRKRSDGVLMLIAIKEHATRIEVGFGLEGAIPDVIASRVIREIMAPHFRNDDFAGGIDAGLDALMKAAQGESLGPPPALHAPAGKWSWFAALALVLLLIIMALPRLVRAPFFGIVGSVIGWHLWNSSLLGGMVGGSLGFVVGLVVPALRGGSGYRSRGWSSTTTGGSSWGSSSSSSSGGGFSGGGFSGGGGSFGGGGASGGW